MLVIILLQVYQLQTIENIEDRVELLWKTVVRKCLLTDRLFLYLRKEKYRKSQDDFKSHRYNTS